jgi:hypothetical protein
MHDDELMPGRHAPPPTRSLYASTAPQDGVCPPRPQPRGPARPNMWKPCREGRTVAALSPGPLSSVLPPRARGTPSGKGKFGVGLVGERGEEGGGRACVVRLDPNPEPKCRERERPADPPHRCAAARGHSSSCRGGTATLLMVPLYVPSLG